MDLEFQWLRPDRALELAGRCASLVLGIACASNVLLHWVAHNDDWFEVTISVVAAIAAIGMLVRVVVPVSRFSEYATWLAAGMWAASILEVATADIGVYGKWRNAGFYLAFLIGSASLYLVERIVLHTKPAPP